MEVGTIERLPADLIEQFRSIPTSTLSDVLDGMQIDGVILGLRACRAGVRFAGTAVTVKGITGVRGMFDRKEYAFESMLEACVKGDVLVQDIGGDPISCLGGIASYAARHRGLAGAVIDGGARDIDEINECGFSVVARHFVPTGAKTRIKLVSCNLPVKIRGIRVAPGDIVVADSSAVAVVPRAVAAQVAAEARECCRHDAEARKAIDAGMSFGEVKRKFPKV